MTGTMKPRRWFRFSLRTMFVVLTVFGVWLGVQVKWIKDRHAAIRWLEARGGSVDYGRAAPMSLVMLGENGVAVLCIPRTDDDYVGKGIELENLFPEANMFRIREDTAIVKYWLRPYPQ